VSTYILVHGSWSGGWQWKPVRDLLEHAGHRVLAPSLTGMADRHHLATPDIGLRTHIDDIVRLIEWEDLHDIILVGHSYGGMVITGAAAARPERIAHLVYLDAFLPRPEEAAWDILPWQRDAFEPLRRTDRPWLVDPVDMAAFFPELGSDFPTRLLTPMPIATHTQPVGDAPTPGTIPGTFLHATTPAFFDGSAERAGDDGMRVIDIDAGHMLLTRHPELVAQLLVEASNGVRT
jgi:pimeloyl-ACP methyl ester carboxylesterase